MPRLFTGDLKQRFMPVLLRRSSDKSQQSVDNPTTTTTSKPSSTAPPDFPSITPQASSSQCLQQEDGTNLARYSSAPAINPTTTKISIAIPSPSLESSSAHKQDPGDSALASPSQLPAKQRNPAQHNPAVERATTSEDGRSDSTVIGRQPDSLRPYSLNEHTPTQDDTARLLNTSDSRLSSLPAEDLEKHLISPEKVMAQQNVLHKRVWVKRQGASATLVQLGEDDLVDDVRDKILRKYANSLGKTFDSPDVTLRIIPRADSHGLHERALGPEEAVSMTLNQYYPAGQTVEEALVIDIPHRRTPRHSPRVYMEHHRPSENAGDYFSVMPVAINHSPNMNGSTSISTLPQQPLHTISVLNTGQLPTIPLPSPGAASRRHATHRPKYGRTTTSSPTVITTTTTHSSAHTDRIPGTPGLMPLPTPPTSTALPPMKTVTPPPRASSPRPAKGAKPKTTKKAPASASKPTSLFDGSVPPISVLIVEDNSINLKLLEMFMRRLKVRWQTAMNGRDAVKKWRTGGFHLVLMDIQLPIMNGLEATREIRRLESVNGIGVLSAKVGDTLGSSDSSGKVENSDQLENMDQFKSPVIVVALTASSLQSDRHEALAAGCNDFLTKPVNFVYLERKVMEWGCMQALIDFDGWRRWKDFAQSTATAATKTSKPAAITGSSNTTTQSAAKKSSRVVTETNSDSTDAADTPPSNPTRQPIPDTLKALNQQTESGDTIESVDSMASNESVETIDLSTAPRHAPFIPTLSTQSSSSSSSTVVPKRGSISRQSSEQSTRAPFNRDGFPLSPNRLVTNGTTISPSSSVSHEEARRRKRSSIGRTGLSGVVEELEGFGSQ